MGIEDLKLEFEDENAEKDKSNGVIDLDVELSFNAGAAKKAAQAAQATPASAPTNIPKAMPVAPDEKTNPNIKVPSNVKNLQVERQKRVQTASHPNLAKKLAETNEPPMVDRFASIDEVQFLKEEVEELRSEISNIKVEAEVRARVAEEKAKFLVDYHSEAKMLNYQMTQLLQRMSSKAPALKSELLMSKKLLDEFLKKLDKK